MVEDYYNVLFAGDEDALRTNPGSARTIARRAGGDTEPNAAKRELTDEEALHQAAALRDYLSRGGTPSRWFESKGFAPADSAAILAASRDCDGEGVR